MLRSHLYISAIIAALVLSVFSVAFAQESSGQNAPALPSEITEPSIPPDELIIRLVPLTEVQLEEAAKEWQQIVQEKTQEVSETQIEVMRSEGDVAATARERLAELVRERGNLFDSYGHVVDAWEKKGGDEAAIGKYRAYRSSILVEETRSADLRTLAAQAIEWAKDRNGGVALAINVGIILASLLGLLFLARIIRGVAGREIQGIPNISQLLQAFFIGVAYWLTIVIGLMVVCTALGIDVSPVFALLGGAAFVLAFALQDTLGNLASGLMIMFNRPFDVGDYVEAGGVSGTVESVSIVSTTVTTPDNQVIIIPNKSVWGSVITNVTSSPTRRVDLVFGIGYNDSIEDAQRVLEETVEAHPLILKSPEPTIRVNELGESSVNFICRPWVSRADYWTVYWDLQRQVKERFDQEGISIPFPQRDLHVYSHGKADPDAKVVESVAPATATPGTDETFARAEPGESERD
jgi:small conductance mechanosensitive channel